VVTERIVVDAVPAQAPQACRPGIEAGGAITCRDDLTLYISHTFLTLIESHFSGLDEALAFASVASHEFGHVLQYTLRQPQIEQKRPSDTTAQFVEQQADCLSGVWAGSAAAHHDLDANEFVNDAEQLIALVSNNPEIATHGSPPTRRAAIERGIAGGSAGVCNLVTFH
jgi:predicted metalloprotease